MAALPWVLFIPSLSCFCWGDGMDMTQEEYHEYIERSAEGLRKTYTQFVPQLMSELKEKEPEQLYCRADRKGYAGELRW